MADILYVSYLQIGVDLGGVIIPECQLAKYLQGAERARFNKYIVNHKKVEFFLARKLCKKIISELLEISVDSLELRPDTFGKPQLFIDGQLAFLNFNISHTAGLISCVVSETLKVGIDVEYNGGCHNDILERFFHHEERIEHQKLNPEQKIINFYTLWTLKEAYLKTMGQGLAIGLDSFYFSGLLTGNISLIITGRPDHNLQFFIDRPTDKHFGALGVETSGKLTLCKKTYKLGGKIDILDNAPLKSG